MSRRRAPFRALLAGLLVVLAAGCASAPGAVGRDDVSALSSEERALGRQEHEKVLAEYGGAYGDEALQAYVREVGERVKAVSGMPDEDFTFTVLNSPIANAFALPGGYVYVSRGLLALADDEAELAGVLAHEIGHVTARHSAGRQTRGVGAQLGVLGATILGQVFGGDVGGQLAQQLGGLGAQAYVQGYSRGQEFEADQLGIATMAEAGYDPRAMASFLTTLGRNDALDAERAGRDPDGGAPSWLASHPRTPDRVRRAAESAESAAGETVRNAGDYLRAIDGLIYGDDPDQGFVRGRAFVHPALRFAFEAPPGFRLANSPSRVIGGDEAGRVMVFEGGQAPSGTDAADFLAASTDGQVEDVEAFEVDGLDAARGLAVISVDDRAAEGVLYAIRAPRGSMVYRLTFVSDGRLSRDEANAFQDSAESFRALSAAEARRFTPLRVRVVRVDPGDTASELTGRMDVPDLKAETFAVLNGLEAGEGLEGRRLVKLLVQGDG